MTLLLTTKRQQTYHTSVEHTAPHRRGGYHGVGGRGGAAALHHIYIYIIIYILCVYVCMCVGTYVCKYLYVWMDGWMDGWMCLRVYVYIDIHVCMLSYIVRTYSICICICICLCLCLCLCICICICICPACVCVSSNTCAHTLIFKLVSSRICS